MKKNIAENFKQTKKNSRRLNLQEMKRKYNEHNGGRESIVNKAEERMVKDTSCRDTNGWKTETESDDTERPISY